MNFKIINNFFGVYNFLISVCYIISAKDEESEAWTAKNYYDPLPTAISPPEAIFQPSLYSFKILNGAHPNHIPHAVINPAVLQYPPGHVLEDRSNFLVKNCHVKAIQICKTYLTCSKLQQTIHPSRIPVEATAGHRPKSPPRIYPSFSPTWRKLCTPPEIRGMDMRAGRVGPRHEKSSSVPRSLNKH